MTEASIPVDLFNPGQVFACVGMLEAAEVLVGNAEGVFDWSDEADVRFRLRARGDESPVQAVLFFLSRAEAFGEAPEGSACLRAWKPAWGELRSRSAEYGYPIPDPETPATVACCLSDGTTTLGIDYWGDSIARTGRDNAKFWAGAGGYPGVALARDALALVRADAIASASDPFSVGKAMTSSFRLDWRRDYIPIDAGFSLNEHHEIEPVGYPLVELLAAIGLSNARPTRPAQHDKLQYLYAVMGRSTPAKSWIPLPLLRAAVGGSQLPFPTRRFRMFLGWPGKEGHARAITTVREETSQ